MHPLFHRVVRMSQGSPRGDLSTVTQSTESLGKETGQMISSFTAFSPVSSLSRKLMQKKKKNRKQFTINMAVIIQRPGSASTDVEEKKNFH